MISWYKPNTSQTSDPLASQMIGITTTPGQGKPILINVDFSKKPKRPEESDAVFPKCTKKTQDPSSVIAFRNEEDFKAFSEGGMGTHA